MCGVIFGECRGEEPADKDMPEIENRRKYYFQKEEKKRSINWLQSIKMFESNTKAKEIYFCFNISRCGALYKREFPSLEHSDFSVCSSTPKNPPGASAAAVELLRPGCGKTGEGKAWTGDCAMVGIRGAPLGMNSLAAGLGAWRHKCITKHHI